nr:MAG TPA: zinc-ribbon containing domain protein [Caudoviricetes sp.]
MDDLISREAAIAIMQAKGEMAMGTPANVFYCAAHMLEMMPAMDAEPVRHGRWVFDKNANDWGIGGYVCSECKAKNNNLPCAEVAVPSMFMGTKYCPSCGAKMDEEQE